MSASDIIASMKEFQECLETFKDDKLFDILRMYLGEIKTPFNKQKLLEQFSGFFINQENRKNILNLLSDFDIKIITAVSVIQNATQSRLEEYFSGEYLISDICDKINNLVERLIIVYKKPEGKEEPVIVINPLLKDLFKPLISNSVLLPQVVYSERLDEISFFITPQFLAAVLSYVQQYPELCKNDRSLKKKDKERLAEIFMNKIDVVQKIFDAYLNLGVLRQGETSIEIDSGKLAAFSSLKPIEQYIYLCTAGAGFLSRESLRIQAQILTDTISSIPAEGVTRHSILQIAFLIGNKNSQGGNEPFARRRFSMIVEKNRAVSENAGDESIGEQSKNHVTQIMDKIVDYAIDFGIFRVSGKNEKGEEIYVPGPALDQVEFPPAGFRKVLNIDAGTNITVLPGLELSDFIKIIPFMHIISCSTVVQFEISRKSVCHAFDKGYKIEKILEILGEYTAYEIPQSLKINIDDWNKAYSNAMLFKGYVLKIDEKNVSLAENNPKITPYIQLKLAPGVYLLNIPLEEDGEQFLKTCGLDFIGSVKVAKQEHTSLGFPLIKKGSDYFADDGFAGFADNLGKDSRDEEEGFKLYKEFSEKLNELKLTAQEKECLQYRIKRGIIVNSSQLNSGTVRIETLEAGGMDYAGKIHLINNAISTESMLEITVSSDLNPGKIEKLFGLPQLLTRAEDSAVVRITIEPEKEIRVFSVGRISHIKMIRRYI